MSNRTAGIVVPVCLLLFVFLVEYAVYQATKKPVPFSHKD